MRKMILKIAASVILAWPVAVKADPVVVELYTSQGCSSCPPADALLHELAARDDVIALALHVDYWDYIGWKDIFANPAYSARQWSYAKVSGRKMVYTPQMIINGSEHVVGNRPRDVIDLIKKHKGAVSEVALSAERKGNKLHIRADAARPLQGPLMVQVLRYTPRSSVDIKRGENAGRKLSYANVVTDLRAVAEWDTRKPLAIKTEVTGDQPIVVLVQQQGYGRVAAVARIK